MIPQSISLILSGASPKLQPNFPLDPRFDLTLTYNNQVVFKLKRAYLKCWSKYFDREIQQNTIQMAIVKEYDNQRMANVLSTIYGHSCKVALEELPEYLKISSFLEVEQLKENIRNHLMAYHEKFDVLQLLSLAVTHNDKELTQQVLETLESRDFSDLKSRREDIMNMSMDVFSTLAQFLSRHVKGEDGISWVAFNHILKEFSSKTHPELYLSFRDKYINIDSLTSEEYSRIFVGDMNPPLGSRADSHKLKLQISEITLNRSIFFDDGVTAEFKKTMEKANRNQDKFNSLLSRVSRLQDKNKLSGEEMGKVGASIGALMMELQRLNSKQISTLMASEAKAFVEEDETDGRRSIKIDESTIVPMHPSTLTVDQKANSDEILSFSQQPTSLQKQQYNRLSKILGFDSFSKGHLRLIWTSQSGQSRQQFLSVIEGRQELVFLMYVFEDNKHVGAYTSAKIDPLQIYNYDEESFIFSLTEGCKFRTLQPSKSIKFDSKHLISFSSDLQIHSNVLEEMSTCHWPNSYEAKKVPNPVQWLVGNPSFHISQFQVFEVIRIQIDMDMDL